MYLLEKKQLYFVILFLELLANLKITYYNAKMD